MAVIQMAVADGFRNVRSGREVRAANTRGGYAPNFAYSDVYWLKCFEEHTEITENCGSLYAF